MGLEICGVDRDLDVAAAVGRSSDIGGACGRIEGSVRDGQQHRLADEGCPGSRELEVDVVGGASNEGVAATGQSDAELRGRRAHPSSLVEPRVEVVVRRKNPGVHRRGGSSPHNGVVKDLGCCCGLIGRELPWLTVPPAVRLAFAQGKPQGVPVTAGPGWRAAGRIGVVRSRKPTSARRSVCAQSPALGSWESRAVGSVPRRVPVVVSAEACRWIRRLCSGSARNLAICSRRQWLDRRCGEHPHQ